MTSERESEKPTKSPAERRNRRRDVRHDARSDRQMYSTFSANTTKLEVAMSYTNHLIIEGFFETAFPSLTRSAEESFVCQIMAP